MQGYSYLPPFRLPLQDTGFGIKTQLYGKLLENERRYNTVDLQLDVKYRDLTDSDNNWIRSSAEIVGEGFSLLDDNIALLRNVKAEIGRDIRSGVGFSIVLSTKKSRICA